jgi:hypothetical protein
MPACGRPGCARNDQPTEGCCRAGVPLPTDSSTRLTQWEALSLQGAPLDAAVICHQAQWLRRGIAAPLPYPRRPFRPAAYARVVGIARRFIKPASLHRRDRAQGEVRTQFTIQFHDLGWHFSSTHRIQHAIRRGRVSQEAAPRSVSVLQVFGCRGWIIVNPIVYAGEAGGICWITRAPIPR